MADGIQANNEDTMEKLDALDELRLSLLAQVSAVLIESFDKGRIVVSGEDEEGEPREYEFTFQRGEPVNCGEIQRAELN